MSVKSYKVGSTHLAGINLSFFKSCNENKSICYNFCVLIKNTLSLLILTCLTNWNTSLTDMHFYIISVDK